MRTALYLRISEDKTGQGAGVQRQEAECRAMAERHGWEITEVYTDNDLSATTGVRRPGFEALLASRPDRIIVWHTDRLVRRMRDLERVIDLEKPVHAVEAGHLDLSNAAGRAVARTLTAWATYEGEHKAERQRLANLQRAQRGVASWSRRPYGFEREGGVVSLVEHEVQVIRDAAEAVLGGATLGSVVRDLNERGVTTSTGGRWSVTSLKRVLTNPRVAGVLLYRGVPYAEDHPAILDRQTHEMLVAVLSDPARRTAPASTRAKYLLSGLATCGACGGRMYVTTNISGAGRRTQVLRCKGCPTTRLYAPTEAWVRQVLVERLSLPDLSDLLVSPDETQAQREEVAAEVAALRQREKDLAALLADGLLSAPAVREQATRLHALLEPLERRLAALGSHSPMAGIADAPDPAQAFLDAPLEAQRTVLATLLTVTVLPVGKGRRWSRDGILIGKA